MSQNSLLLTVFAATALTSAGWAAPPGRTLAVDAVELVAGREVAGRDEWSVEHEGIGYLFANAANKAAFERNPATFEVADGGACGRMGPLSGLGDARRFAVHEGRIYLFASDGCRAAFLKEPAKYIETDDEMPFGSNESVLEGRAALDRLVAWMGGADRIKRLKSLQATAARRERQGDTDWSVTNETVIAFPDRYFAKEAWNESWYSTTSGPEGAAMASRDGIERIAASRGRAFRRTLARWPIVLAKAHVDGSPRADCPGLVVVGDGAGELDGAPVDYVRVWLNGAASRLTLDKATGKPLQLAFRGRDGTIGIGDSVRTFTEYVDVDGLKLPSVFRVSFNGEDLPSAGAKVDAFRVDEALPADLFEIPR